MEKCCLTHGGCSNVCRKVSIRTILSSRTSQYMISAPRCRCFEPSVLFLLLCVERNEVLKNGWFEGLNERVTARRRLNKVYDGGRCTCYAHKNPTIHNWHRYWLVEGTVLCTWYHPRYPLVVPQWYLLFLRQTRRRVIAGGWVVRECIDS